MSFIEERQAAGIAKAKEKGVYKGRPVSLDHDLIKRMAKGGHGATAIAKNELQYLSCFLTKFCTDEISHENPCNLVSVAP